MRSAQFGKTAAMDVASVMERCGGLITRAALISATSRAETDTALRRQIIVRVGHGRYALPAVDAAAATAHRMNGHLSYTSAALHHGWEVKWVPDLPHVTFPTKRRVPREWRTQVVLHRADLLDDNVNGIVTSREVTLMQCLRRLPEDEALVVADSALRHGEDATLRRVAASVRGTGAARVRRIAACADPRSANAFESVTRAICLKVDGLHVVPQVEIEAAHGWARPDLVDRERRIVIECDSFEWHGNREGFRKDVGRYTMLTAAGWQVLRFTWEDVMFRPAWVAELLTEVIRKQTVHAARRIA